MNPLGPRAMLCLFLSSSPNADVPKCMGVVASTIWAVNTFSRDPARWVLSQRQSQWVLGICSWWLWTRFLKMALRWTGKSNSSCFPWREQVRTWKCQLPERKQKPLWRAVSPAILSSQIMWSYRKQTPGNLFLRLSAVILGLPVTLKSDCPSCPA